MFTAHKLDFEQKWAQDVLKPPPGFGTLSPVSEYNARKVKREYFSYVANVTGLAAGTQQSVPVALRDDGDFWLSSLSFTVYNGTALTSNCAALVKITDVRSGFELFEPYAPVRGLLSQGGNNSARAQDIITPYCFVRGGVMRVTYTVPAGAGAPNFSIYGIFNGWLEYEHAAR